MGRSPTTKLAGTPLIACMPLPANRANPTRGALTWAGSTAANKNNPSCDFMITYKSRLLGADVDAGIADRKRRRGGRGRSALAFESEGSARTGGAGDEQNHEPFFAAMRCLARRRLGIGNRHARRRHWRDRGRRARMSDGDGLGFDNLRRRWLQNTRLSNSRLRNGFCYRDDYHIRGD